MKGAEQQETYKEGAIDGEEKQEEETDEAHKKRMDAEEEARDAKVKEKSQKMKMRWQRKRRQRKRQKKTQKMKQESLISRHANWLDTGGVSSVGHMVTPQAKYRSSKHAQNSTSNNLC